MKAKGINLNYDLTKYFTEMYLYILVGIIINTGAFLLIYLYYNILPTQVPLYYFLSWGEKQLAQKIILYIVPTISSIFFFLNLFLSYKQYKAGSFRISKLYNIFSVSISFIFGLFLYRIVYLSALQPIEIPSIIKLIGIPVVLSFATTIIASNFVIKFANKFGLIDDPLTHPHPAMLLTKPTPRAGGLAYFLGIIVPAFLVLPILSSQKIIGILLGAFICVVTGLKDDKKDINPFLRLFVQGLTILITALSGIILIYVPNPFGQHLSLDQYKFTFEFFGKHSVFYLSVILAGFWIATTMNFMSFANGTDGVYAGLVFVASFVIALLMFGSIQVDPEMAKYVKLASLSAGAALGMAFFTWPPQKFLWGFGATSAGLIIASLSIIGSTKVATMLIVLLIPFLDGLVAVIRRIKRKQLPFWGDREHLHHKLLFKLNWSKSKVATFYWITTMFLGAAGILSGGKSRAIWLGSLITIFILSISILNLIRAPAKSKQRKNISN